MRFKKSGAFVGKRIELSPSLDLWMRGARFGEIVAESVDHADGELMQVKVRMDHPQVRRLVRLRVADIGRIL